MKGVVVRKKYIAVLGFAIAVLLMPLALVGAAHATGFRSGGSVIVGKSEVVDGTLFATGQTIEIAGAVNGDVFCAGNSVTITGTVHGDVICAGQTVDVRGTVDGNVRVAGAIVNVGAKVGRSVSAAGQTVTLQSDGQARDVQAAGSTVAINGTVARDAALAGATLDINGSIGRDVSASGGMLALGSGAKVAGNIDYQSHNKLTQANDATVGGTVHQNVPKDSEHNKNAAQKFFSGINWFFAIAGFITSLILVALIPRVFYSVTSHGVNEPGMSFLAGLATNVGVFIVMILLAITFIGLPLALLVLVAWVLLLMLSLPVFSFYLGRVLLSKSTNNLFYYMLLGAFIVLLLNFIPVIGSIVLFLGSWFGVGMLTLRIARHWSTPRYTLKPDSKKA
jgi:hypothetical protein